MPRSKYIYFVREANYPGSYHRLLGTFTVKHEANRWAVLNGWGPENANLSRMRDGVDVDKAEVEIPWSEESV